MISISPHQKIGIEWPTVARPITPWSTSVPRFKAATAPSGRPTPRASANAHRANSTVAGNNAANSSDTGSRETIEVPRSPLSVCLTYVPYCASSGRSSPS